MLQTVNERLAEILAAHFHPQWGSAYWIERQKNLGFDPRHEITEPSQLARMGAMPLEALALRPIEHFVPRRFHEKLNTCISSETGGTTGKPKRTVFLPDEFDEAFVAPFVAAAKLVSFPQSAHWLFIGPSGPHVIGKAARACAQAMGSMDPFTVDFDPRWVHKLPQGSFARQRYIEHVLAQSLDILQTQDIRVLFATPPVLQALGEKLAASLRDRVAGIHLGGMTADREFRVRLANEWFPNAVSLSGYGNSLAGVCPELAPQPEEPPAYFSHGSRLLLGIQKAEENPRGRVVFHRLDLSCFLPNVVERDEAFAASKPDIPGAEAFQVSGIADPRPVASGSAVRGAGLY